jgi:hypothetical protein
MAADMRLAAESAILIAGYPRIGASPDGGLTLTLQQAMGYEQTMRFLLENRTVTAAEALKLGLVGEVVPDGEFEERFAAYCAFIAERAPIASRLTKRAVVRAWNLDLTDHVRYELANIRRAFASEDSKEAIRVFWRSGSRCFGDDEPDLLAPSTTEAANCVYRPLTLYRRDPLMGIDGAKGEAAISPGKKSGSPRGDAPRRRYRGRLIPG